VVLIRRLSLLSLAVSMSACIHRAPLVHFDTQTPVAVVVVLDGKTESQVDVEPPELRAAIEHELARRNLVAESVPAASLAPLTRTREDRARCDLLAKALGPNRLLLLVQLRVNFFGQFEGGYKWNVGGQLTVAQSDQINEATSAPLDIAAFLDQDFEREREAIQQTASTIADRVGELFDQHFAGRAPASTPDAPPHPAAP
jgi:hypothetical protein